MVQVLTEKELLKHRIFGLLCKMDYYVVSVEIVSVEFGVEDMHDGK